MTDTPITTRWARLKETHVFVRGWLPKEIGEPVQRRIEQHKPRVERIGATEREHISQRRKREKGEKA